MRGAEGMKKLGMQATELWEKESVCMYKSCSRFRGNLQEQFACINLAVDFAEICRNRTRGFFDRREGEVEREKEGGETLL